MEIYLKSFVEIVVGRYKNGNKGGYKLKHKKQLSEKTINQILVKD